MKKKEAVRVLARALAVEEIKSAQGGNEVGVTNKPVKDITDTNNGDEFQF
jgi:hypothetical protein